MHTVDLAVLGVGAVGSGAMLSAAARGLRVLGLERFEPGHTFGSSHGETRLIRKAYFEAPAYVPLLERAYVLWRELEAASGRCLLEAGGILEVGPSDGEVVQGILQSAATHGLQVEPIASSQVSHRFPGIRLPDGMAALYETDGGYLHVEEAIKAQCEVALGLGAELWTGTEVMGIERSTGYVTLQTSRGPVHARHVVCSAGPWSHQVLGDLALPLRVKRKVLAWFALRPEQASLYQGSQGVSFLFEMPDGVVYGFPSLDGVTLKVASHDDGHFIEGPDQIERRLQDDDLAQVRAFATNYLVGVNPDQVLRHAVCMYTMTPDLHMVVDHHPADERIWYAAGLSGHGFKYSNALGEALIQLATEGQSVVDLSGFRAARFSGE